MSEEKLIGRLCRKIAGREGNRVAVIVNVLGNNFVEIDGQVKRRKCNLSHLEILNKQLKIKAGISTEELKDILKKESILIEYKKKDEIKKKPLKLKTPGQEAQQAETKNKEARQIKIKKPVK